MLRASSQRPAFLLPPPPYSLCNLRRLPLLPSLAFASFKAVHTSPASSSLLPSAARARLCTPFTSRSSLSRSTLSGWCFFPVPIRMPTRRHEGRVCFSASSSEGSTGKERMLQHLLVGEGDLKLLLELQRKISEGVDLSDLAVEYSICPSKQSGGMLGWVRKGQMVPEFEEAAFSAPMNKVVRCKTKFGWHLLEVLSEREESLLQDIEPVELHSRMQDPSFIEEAQLIDVREPEEVDKASLPGFKVLPLRQFGTWASDITNNFDPQKDTYVLVSINILVLLYMHVFMGMWCAGGPKPKEHGDQTYYVLSPWDEVTAGSPVAANPGNLSLLCLFSLGSWEIIKQQGWSLKAWRPLPLAAVLLMSLLLLGSSVMVSSGIVFDLCQQTHLICFFQGFRRVFNVAGGIHAYALKADPSIPTY